MVLLQFMFFIIAPILPPRSKKTVGDTVESATFTNQKFELKDNKFPYFNINEIQLDSKKLFTFTLSVSWLSPII